MQATFSEAINKALHDSMQASESVICYGLGADDPKRIFNTMVGLKETFGDRVFDTPTSENAMTGIGIGAALTGLRPVMTHQRVDFFLLAFDQLVNNAAKWHYMFDGQASVPITIRLIIGRGWGQGPTHAQNLHSIFAHIPGLKVVMPTTPNDAYHMLRQSIDDDNPVVFLEHRWLHNQIGEIDFADPPGFAKAGLLQAGEDITLVSMSYLTVESLRAAEALKQRGISAEVIDLRSIQPLDIAAIRNSVEKTGRLMVLDSGAESGSFAGEIISRITESCFDSLHCPPKRMALPDIPEPTSYALTKHFYYGAKEIAEAAHFLVSSQQPFDLYQDLIVEGHHDVPGDYFKGPF